MKEEEGAGTSSNQNVATPDGARSECSSTVTDSQDSLLRDTAVANLPTQDYVQQLPRQDYSSNVFSISNQSTPKYTPIIPAGDLAAMDNDSKDTEKEEPFPSAEAMDQDDEENDDYM